MFRVTDECTHGRTDGVEEELKRHNSSVKYRLERIDLMIVGFGRSLPGQDATSGVDDELREMTGATSRHIQKIDGEGTQAPGSG